MNVEVKFERGLSLAGCDLGCNLGGNLGCILGCGLVLGGRLEAVGLEAECCSVSPLHPPASTRAQSVKGPVQFWG